jgi:hypothetical protein
VWPCFCSVSNDCRKAQFRSSPEDSLLVHATTRCISVEEPIDAHLIHMILVKAQRGARKPNCNFLASKRILRSHVCLSHGLKQL